MTTFARPTLTEIVTRVEQDFVSRLSLVGAILRRSIVRIWARVIAGASHMLHGHIAWGIQQLFLDKCEVYFVARWAAIFGVPQNAAVFSSGTFTATGSNGSVIAAGAGLQRSDGVTYTTQADATIASGTAIVTVTADVAAANGDCDVGVSLSFVEPIAGVDSAGTVISISGGEDQEGAEAWRARVLARIQQPPHGGNDADYEAWAKQIAGVTRVWVVRNGNGPGTVVVYFLRDDDLSGPIPDFGEIATVQAYLDVKRPVTADVTVYAPIADVMNFTIHLSPNTLAAQEAVDAELADLLRRESEPSVTTLISHVRTAIGNAVTEVAGESGDYVLTSPSTDTTHSTGHIAIMGTVTYD